MNSEPAQPADFVTLYRRAFAEFGARALWSTRSLEAPTPEDALVVARALRIEGTVKPGALPSKSNKLAVPLTKIQIDILKAIASHRDPESYVAGGTALNRDALRYSGDIDIFHDREECVASAAVGDVEALRAAGYGVSWLRQLPLIYTAEVMREDASTRLEWVADSDFRFFPTLRDETFGYLLHPVDLAINKAMAAAGPTRGAGPG
ncbi:MAG: hypothetical protein WBW33_17605 [Bryobacteraceae bacterium]